MRKRAAIVIPGLVRRFRERHESLFKNIVRPNREEWDIDIFLMFWNKTKARKESVLHEVDPDEVLSIYQPTDYSVYSFSFNKSFIPIGTALFHAIPKKEREVGFYINSFVAQFFTWKTAMDLVPDGYDLVLKTRFDCNHPSPVHFSSLDPSLFHCGEPWRGKHGVCDFSFASNQQLMTSLFDFCWEFVNNPKEHPSFLSPIVFPERIVGKFVEDQGVRTRFKSIPSSIK